MYAIKSASKQPAKDAGKKKAKAAPAGQLAYHIGLFLTVVIDYTSFQPFLKPVDSPVVTLQRP